ncbi:MAG: HlyD family type I secretion periplasmic adaptor subunit [Rickettsia sp.]|nr:HlyD family type I secretion periplasmic adaptor subunit [Rickettsia sp.]
MDQNNSKKITPDQLKILQQKILEMQKMQISNNGSNTANLKSKMSFKSFIKYLHPKTIFALIIVFMNQSVKHVDSLIKFIIKKDLNEAQNVAHHARPPILFGSFIIVFFVLTGLIWSVTAPLDSASGASGMLISLSKRQTINHPDGGMIKNIFIKLGDQVKKGDPLLELEDRRVSLNYKHALSKFRTYSAVDSRIFAEMKNLDEITYDDILLNYLDDEDVLNIINTQNELFSSRTQLKKNMISSHEESIKIIQKHIEALRNKHIAIEKKLNLWKKKVDNSELLEKKGFSQSMQTTEFQTEMISTQVELENNQIEIIRLEQEIAKKELEGASQINDWNVRLYSELKENQNALFVSQEEFYTWNNALNGLILRAPIDGSVNQIVFYTQGQHIPPSQPIVEITPLNEELIIEAHVRSRDIDSIKVGQKSKIKFSAFKSRTSPTFSGQVISISPDIVQRSLPEPVSKASKKEQAEPTYIAEIQINMEEFNKIAQKRNLKLHPGMQVEVQIVTGSRTLMRYLLDPVLDAAFKGLKEK